MAKRVFLIVLDSFGIGAEPDAAAFGDEGTNTLGAIARHPAFRCPNLGKLGLFNIDGVTAGEKNPAPAGAFARLQEQSQGKDTTIGHWEIAGVVSPNPLPTFPEGFPAELIRAFEEKTGHKVLCNKPYSGTQVLKDYGEQALAENALIVYTSADSVFQVAAHEELVPVQELYRYCEIAREMLKGEFGVGRVIARPFVGRTADTFARTTNRHDLSLKPPRDTMLDVLKAAGRDVIAVGKIYDIFDGQGVTEKIKTTGNTNGIAFTKALLTRDFEGLAFVNLVDFDMLYGHRRNVEGYAAAATEFDGFLAEFVPHMREEDLLIVTADHGCDPSYTKTTDHTREYVPFLACGKPVRAGVDLGTRLGFGTIAATVCDYLGVDASALDGVSVWPEIQA
ncbi:MAG: phosphopentomutase [Candidatus Faecalibacterium intestinavium]|uniref:Phosphopentomutase n=1 Tax=Candidatus Faecalibacterium intestinavium TaxID=2838580 RepID=A0A9E2NQS3_9FIRM|nr:phosphopentomutase [Candidatus Faecalibacterium intestinavium]